MLAGGAVTNGVGVNRTANVSAVGGELMSVAMVWDWVINESVELSGQGMPSRVENSGIYVNGVLRVKGEDGKALVGPLESGNHEVDVKFWEFGSAPRFFVDSLGSQVLLRWAGSEDSRVRGYRVFAGEAAGDDAAEGGEVSYDAAVDEVDLVEVDSFRGGYAVGKSSGGRVSIGGIYRGEVVNEVWRVRLAEAPAGQPQGTALVWEYSRDDGGSWVSGEGVFGGVTFGVEDGVRGVFLDPVGSYEAGDYWRFSVGAQRWWVSGELGRGVYKFGIKAVTVEGRLSDAVEVDVFVSGESDPVSDLVGSFEAGSDSIVLGWTDPEVAPASVRVYSSWDRVWGFDRGYVMEENALEAVSAGVEECSIDVSGWESEHPQGAPVRFYVRVVDSHGVEEKNLGLLEVFVGEVVSVLGYPYGLSGVMDVSGGALLGWFYDLRDGVPGHFAVYAFDSEPVAGDFDGETPVSVAMEFTELRGERAAFSWVSGVLSAGKWFVVRAVDGDGHETDNVGGVFVEPESGSVGGVGSVTGGGV